MCVPVSTIPRGFGRICARERRLPYRILVSGDVFAFGKSHECAMRFILLLMLLKFSVSARTIFRGQRIRLYASKACPDQSVGKLSRLHVSSHLALTTKGLQLDSQSSNYLGNVMRLKAGSQFRAFNPSDGEFLCEVGSESKRGSTVLDVVKQLRSPASDEESLLSSLVLYFAPIRKTRVKFLLEKASELGVSDLVPVTTQNTQWPLNHAAAQRQLVESAEQSERMSIASLHSPIHLSQLFAEWEPAHGGDSATGPPRDEGNNHFLLVCRERGFEQSRPLLSVLRELSKLGPGAPVRLLVGPEGGFTAAELAAMEKLPFVRFVSLGPTLLRSETAALAALAAVQLHQDSYEKPS